MLGDLLPQRHPFEDARGMAADDVGQQNLQSREAVGVDRARIAAVHRQETVKLALGVMEAPGAGPP